MFDLTRRASTRPIVHADAVKTIGAWARRLAEISVLPWLIIASILAIFGTTIATVVGWRITSTLPDPDRAGIVINVVALCVALVISVGGGLLFPVWWKRIIGAAAVLPALILIATSGNLAALLTALAVIGPAAWLGRVCASRLLGPLDLLTSWLIGAALGFGFIANLGFILGSVGVLRPAAIWPTLLVLTVALSLSGRQQLRDDLRQFADWIRRPTRRDQLTLLLVGISLALVWYNLIGALSPETASDTVRVRLPTAIYFAQTRHINAGNPELLSIIQTPATGEIANAVLASIGPLEAVKIVVYLQGIACALAIFTLGRRLHSDRAGLCAAYIFFSMPLVSWLSQTAYHDLLVSFLAGAAALVIIARPAPDWRAATIAGIFAGLGVGVKLHFAYVAIGLAAILAINCLWVGGIRIALRSGATMAATAALTAAPWLVRSALLSGQVPGLALATGSLTRGAEEQPTVMSDLVRFGFGRSLGNLIRILPDMTLFSAQFEWIPTRYGPFNGLIGFLLLGLLPLTLVAFPARRRLALTLLAGGGIALIFWFYTAQYLRYALPVLALLCPLGGAAYATIQARTERVSFRVGSRLALLVLILCGVVLQLQVPAMGRTYALGRESDEQYLARNLICCAGYPVIQLLNAEPNVTRIFSTAPLARLHIAARITTPLETSEAHAAVSNGPALLTLLDAGGYSHIVVDRNRLEPTWEANPLIDEAFLRSNTALIGGQSGVYLYRLLPPDQRGLAQGWTAGDELLPIANTLGDERIENAQRWTTIAPITPGTTYLLTHRTRADAGAEQGKASFALIWRDGAGRTIATAGESVPIGPAGFHQFSTLAVAPSGAKTVEIAITAQDESLWLDGLSLRAFALRPARP